MKNSLTIGNLSVNPPLILAPMAGITHLPFRQLVASFGGCGLYFSEMLCARKIPREKKDNAQIVRRAPKEGPFFYQIMGNVKEEMGRAIESLQRPDREDDKGPDGIDINMGCSANAIRKTGAGSGLMVEEDRAKRLVAFCRKRTTLPLTVKIRLGREENLEWLIHFASGLQEEGIDAITLHPRLIKEHFKRAARWKYIQELKKNLTIPVIGNGDIEKISDIDKRMAETNCDGIMIGRLAVRKPWIFQAYANSAEPKIDHPDLFFRFAEQLSIFFDPLNAIRKLKLFTYYFAKNFAFGHYLDSKVTNSKSLDEAILAAHNFFNASERKILI